MCSEVPIINGLLNCPTTDSELYLREFGIYPPIYMTKNKVSESLSKIKTVRKPHGQINPKGMGEKE